MDLLQNIWNAILDLTKLLVIPDWGGLILLLPVFMGVVVIVFLVWLVVQYRGVGQKRRRPGRVQPVAPEGVHMPGPTYAPILAAAGTFLLFLGLVFPGPILVLGVVALVLALLFWGREGLRAYDHVADADVAGEHLELAPVEHPGPPPGVHMPGPSFRPILAAAGVFILFLGLVYPGPILALGLVFLIVALLGWLNDARKEYQRTVVADTTGHLENGPDPRWPKAMAWTFGIIGVFAILITAGLFPPRTAVGGTATGSAAPSGGPSGAPGQLKIVAKNIAFDTKTLAAAADKPFTVLFDNEDAGTSHDWDVLDASGTKVFDGKDFPGVAQKTYDVPALKAGTYKFECSIHPALMNGQLTIGG